MSNSYQPKEKKLSHWYAKHLIPAGI